MNNIYTPLPTDLTFEVFERLTEKNDVRIERIVSRGHATPNFGWCDQAEDEWVIVLKGKAGLSFEDGSSLVLTEGDYVDIKAHTKHRVDWTIPDTETIWLAVHY